MKILRKTLIGLVLVTAANAASADVLKALMGYVLDLVNVRNAETASMKVVASQIAAAAKAQINADTVLAQAAMAARGSLESTKEQLEVYDSFSFKSGQGPQTCDALGQRNDINAIEQRRDRLTFTAMNMAGRSLFPPDSYEAKRASGRMTAYCSADEHNLGLCKSRFDGMAGLSTNFSKLSIQDQFTSKQLKAAEDFVSELVPPPLPARVNIGCGSNCQAERMAALRVDALSSMVAVTMAAQLSGRVGEKTFAAKR